MELKDLLPLFGIAVGWLLAEGSAYGKREIERKRAVGRSLSVLYFFFMEMVQVKAAQERVKNLGNDVKVWERERQRSFKQYTLKDEDLAEKISATADSIGEYYPIEAYKLREVLAKYQFIKNKNLDYFTASPGLYVALLSGNEIGHMIHQHELELIIRFLAFRQSKILWARIRYQFWRMRSRVPKGDTIFLQQLTRSKRNAAVSAVAAEQDAHSSEEPSGGA